MKKEYCVYVHINKINQKRYVGITSMLPEKRWANGRGYRSNTLFYRAICKYGWDKFEHKIIAEHLNKEEAYKKEIEFISMYKSANPKFGYNIDLGGNGSNKTSEATKEKLREIGKEYAKAHPEIGRKLAEYTKTHRDEISQKQRDYNKRHPEKAKRQKEWLKKYYGEHPEVVKKSREKCRKYYDEHPEAREKKSRQTREYFEKHPEARVHNAIKTHEYYQNPEVKKWKSEERKRFFAEHPEKKTTKAVIQCRLDGVMIASFVSAREAEKNTGISYKNISSAVTGKQKTAGGFIWRYKDELQNEAI